MWQRNHSMWYHLHVLILQLTQSKSALNQCCSVLKTQNFWGKKLNGEQCWFRSVFSLKQSWVFQFWTALNSADNCQISETAPNFWTVLIQNKSELIRSETGLVFVDSGWRFAVQFSIFFLRNPSKYFYFEALNSDFYSNWWKKGINKTLFDQSFRRPKI